MQGGPRAPLLSFLEVFMNTKEQLLEYLNGRINESEQKLQQEYLTIFQELAQKSTNISPEKLRKLSIMRIFGSGTLNSNQFMERWDQLNQFIHHKIAIGETPTMQAAQAINTILYPEHNGEIRQMYSRGGEKQYISPKDLPLFQDHFEQFLLKVPSNNLPLWNAFMLYTWGVTLHPFLDGNGRTFRACADWLLLQENLLPVTYTNEIDAHVAISSNTKLPNREKMFLRFLSAVKNSFDFLYGEPDQMVESPQQ